MENRSSQLKKLLSDGNTYIMPGVFECIGAKLAERAGFSLLSITGNGLSASAIGLPDMGLISLKEVVSCAQNIAQSVSIPVIADADTGFGNAINTIRTIREFEQSGVAGVHIEDQSSPKKCAYYDGSRALVTVEEQEQKIAAAVYARTNTDFVIIARTDALKIINMDETLARLERYVAAGADAVFVVGVEDIPQIRRIKQCIDAPLILNVNDGGKLSAYSLEELNQAGVKLMMYPSTVRSAMLKAVGTALAALYNDGRSADLAGLASLEEFNEVIGVPQYSRLEELFLRNNI